MNRNGYFINKYNSDIIKCISSKCEIVEFEYIKRSYTCNDIKNGLISNYDKIPYFCLNSIFYSFSGENNYIILPSVNATAILTLNDFRLGNDILIFKRDAYSISQYVTYDDQGIIFIKNVNLKNL